MQKLWRTTEAALAVDMAQDVQRAEEAATRKVRLKQMENTLQSEQHDDAARDARLAELERLMEEDKQADAEREELIVELRAAQVVASAEHSAERTQLEREIKDLRAELAGQALIATAPIDDVSKAKRVEKAVAARHTEHAEEDARRSEETAARKGKLAEIEALLEQEEQDDQEREARIAELLRVIEEDKVADAQREDFIVELRAAHVRDCYWLVALALCAVDSDDDLINDLIIDGADLGLYGVKLFVNGRWITFLLDDWSPCRAAGGGEEAGQWSPAFCSFSRGGRAQPGRWGRERRI